ncbi:pleckstrin homology domain-containing family A member 3-like isoform X8 [Lepidochelys kempii]|uniref:pleckstrin homology domain-containing family A member 3-like isoform X8 n=1 Tax=Lepidochelys kempii TaxID=8472 RepID=UPI003C6F09A7
MEGALLKWTNYLLGWQPRYFVLDSGILSYYDSQDDVGKGSKGSIKMAVCEIKVHPTDATRMELVIPGEQYFYLKAGGAAERQKWLVALGSSKACLGDSRSQKDKDVHLSSESLGRKLSELRLYCDVLTQQVLDVQESTRPQDNGTPLDIEKMNEAASLLKATCSQFISTLEECMKFANARLAPELYQPSPAPLPQDFVGTKLPHSHRRGGAAPDPGAAAEGRCDGGAQPGGDGDVPLAALEPAGPRARQPGRHHRGGEGSKDVADSNGGAELSLLSSSGSLSFDTGFLYRRVVRLGLFFC